VFFLAEWLPLRNGDGKLEQKWLSFGDSFDIVVGHLLAIHHLYANGTNKNPLKITLNFYDLNWLKLS
jgi:hypothetical protein